MKKMFILLLPACALLMASCNNYGKKVKISDKTEIYIKGKATEDEAKKLGNYIDQLSKESNERSFQLDKADDGYTVRMVIDTKTSGVDPQMNQNFMALRWLFEDKVFTGSHVKLILTDNTFKDFKTVKDTVFTE